MIEDKSAERGRLIATAVAVAESVAGGGGSVTISGREVAIAAALMLVAFVAFGALSWRWGGAAMVGLGVWIAWRAYAQSDVAARAQVSSAGAGDSAITFATFDDTTCRTILSGLPDAAFILDGKSVVIAGNDATRVIFPIETGRHIAQVTRAPELLRAVDIALWRDEPQTLELRLPPPREQILQAHVTPLGGAYTAGRPALLIVLRDMKEADRLSRMRADFVANASHELRTPLASLKGFIETLQGAAKDDPVARERFLGIMQEQASRMSRLIDDLLSLSRVEMREHVAPNGTVDLSVIADDVANGLRHVAAKASIAIDTSAAAEPGLVIGDSDELTQVVQNLMQNAIKYGRKGGKVEITIAPEGQRMAMTVRDDGIGIASHHLPRLTERFYRVNAKDSRERGGTGLGLAIVKHIVSRHRGELRIGSELGKGSTFSVLLPVVGNGRR